MFQNLNLSFTEAHWIVITVLALYTWFINKQSASAKEMLDIRLRVTELESMVKDMPTKVEIARLEGQVDNIKTQLNAVNSNVDKVHSSVTRLHNYLLDNKK